MCAYSFPEIKPMKTNLISMLPWKYIALASAAVLGFGSAARAAIQLDFVYDPVANATTASFSGTWDVAANSPGPGSTEGFASSTSFQSFRISATTNGYGGRARNGVSSPYAWADVGVATTMTGDFFGFTQSYVYGPEGFTAATSIAGTMTWAGKDLTAMGFSAEEIANGGFHSGSAGRVNWTASNLAMVPEPATYGLMTGGLILGCALMRRRRRCGNA
jgi:PEP-CTERM motif